MNWPTAMLFVVVILVGVFKDAWSNETTIYGVDDHETAMRVQTSSGPQFVCLLTGEGYGFTGNSDKWIGFTCAQLGVPTRWRFCRGIAGKPVLECAEPGIPIQGATPKPRDKPTATMSIVPMGG